MVVPTYYFALRKDLENEKQLLPTKAEEKSSGWDVRAAQEDRKPLVISPFEYVKIPLGFRTFCPDGWWLSLVPRSSSFTKKRLHFLYGVVDESYEGFAIAAFQYIPEFSLITGVEKASGYYDDTWFEARTHIEANNLTIEFGEAIGQIIPVKRQEMKVGEKTNQEIDQMFKNRGAKRGVGGFGSTDLNDKK